jgi:transcriptional regulator with XRE-family HTH domain
MQAEELMMHFAPKFGLHIRVLRRERGMTQEQLAEGSGLSVDAIRRIERGAFSPSLETLRKLCGGLRISLRTLFDTFEPRHRNEVAEICDFLETCSRTQIRQAKRVLRALFDGGE